MPSTSPDIASQDSPAELTLYWRPGCGFCANLRRQLASTDLVIHEVDIWAEAGAADVVRRFADGNETVPTVVIGAVDSDGAVGLVNPSGREVITALHAHAPHLLAGDENATARDAG